MKEVIELANNIRDELLRIHKHSGNMIDREMLYKVVHLRHIAYKLYEEGYTGANLLFVCQDCISLETIMNGLAEMEEFVELVPTNLNAPIRCINRILENIEKHNANI